MSQFGGSFKKAREALGISLDKIAQETRISTRFLQAIESEDFHLLPGGIFNRGFIRTYADRVGLDPEQAVADYERLSQASEPGPVLRSVETPPAAKGQQYLYTIAIGALVLAIVLFYFVTRHHSNPAPAPASPAAEASPVAIAPLPPAVLPEPTTVAAAPEPLTAELNVHEATWIKISTDGMPEMEDILRPGTTRRYTAQASLELTIGNAGGVTLKLNDRETQPLGKNGQVKKLSITTENAETF